MQETLQLLSIMTNDNRFEEAYNTNTDGQKGGPRNMCDVLDKVENRGIAKGIAKGKAEGKVEGEDTLALLMLSEFSTAKKIRINNGTYVDARLLTLKRSCLTEYEDSD